MATEMAFVRAEMVMGIDSEMELEMLSGMPSEGELIGYLCFKEICNV